MGFIDFIKRWKLTKQGWSSGKKRRTQSSTLVGGHLDRSMIFKLLMFGLFGFALFLLTRGVGQNGFLAPSGSSQCLVIGLMVISSGMMLYFMGKETLSKNSNVLLLLGGILIHLLMVRTVGYLVDSNGVDKGFKFILIPFALAPMIHSVLLGRQAGVFSVIFVSLMGAWLVNANEALIYMATSMITGALVIGMTGVVRKRGRLLRAGLYVGILVLILAYAFETIGFSELMDGNSTARQMFLLKSFAAFSIGLLTAMVISGLLPIIEGAFSLTTDISWLEQSDLNHKLMRRMQMEAPGTFQHSLAVASLAEAAAESIGANASMCRVCSYFHDIGKLKKPEYFIENQSEDINPHDDLTPTMSALVIIAHVKDGVDMALRNKLNPRIIDIIREHHGDSLTYYFYRKAQEQRRSEDKKVSEGKESSEDLPKIETKNFRYPGPTPQSKESAIISLADTVESASRSLKKTTPQKIQSLVDDLVSNRVAEGQLDDSGLTLAEIKTLRSSFSKSLRSMMHSRIQYPSKEKSTKTIKLDTAEESKEAEATPANKDKGKISQKIVSSEELEKARKKLSGNN